MANKLYYYIVIYIVTASQIRVALAAIEYWNVTHSATIYAILAFFALSGVWFVTNTVRPK